MPTMSPARAWGYFSKTECFCFTAQTLAAGEARDMPVRFIVAPDMPENIHTITLSYTFFKNNELTAQLEAPAGSSDGAREGPCHQHCGNERKTDHGQSHNRQPPQRLLRAPPHPFAP